MVKCVQLVGRLRDRATALFGGKVRIRIVVATVYAIGARLFLSKVPLEVLQNWVLIQLIVTPHFGKSTGSNRISVPINRTVSSNWN